MSRGAGALQRRIMSQLVQTPTKRLAWTDLTASFPVEASQHSLHRSVRLLRERGLVFDHYALGRRYVVLTALGDSGLLALCEAARAQFEAVARARGLPSPSLMEPGSPRREPRAPERDVDA